MFRCVCWQSVAAVHLSVFILGTSGCNQEN